MSGLDFSCPFYPFEIEKIVDLIKNAFGAVGDRCFKRYGERNSSFEISDCPKENKLC
jgi:hypothetical protein